MSDSELEKTIDLLAKRMKASQEGPSNNDRLIELRHKLDTVKSDIQGHDRRLNVYHEALYDPDKGIYTRINRHKSDIEDLKIQLHGFKKIEEKLLIFDTLVKTLKNIAGEDLQDLRNALDAKKKQNYLLVVAVGAAITGAVKMVWDIIYSLSMNK